MLSLLLLLQDLDTLEDRVRAARSLVERGEAPPPESLTSADPEVRSRAALVLEELRWREREARLDAFLADAELPGQDRVRLRIPDPLHALRRVRLYRCGGRLIALRPEGDILLSDAFSEGDQNFAVAALRDLRALSAAERVAAAATCVALLDQFELAPGGSPGECLAGWEPMADADGDLYWGGFTHRHPGLRAGFARDGRLLSANFWYRE